MALVDQVRQVAKRSDTHILIDTNRALSSLGKYTSAVLGYAP